jgi:hypothetical protein
MALHLLLLAAAVQAAAAQPPFPKPPLLPEPPPLPAGGLPARPSGVGPSGLQPQVIRPDQVYYPAKGVLAAPSTAVLSPPLNQSSAPTIETCSDVCRSTPGCAWFTYCGNAGGCLDPGGPAGSMPYQHCRLMADACVLPPLGLSSPQVQVTSGFPTTSVWGDQVLKFTELQGQAIEGADLPCPAASLVPGKCVMSNLVDAIMFCHAVGGLCRAATVYFKGLDGCSDTPVAVLKTTAPYPDNSWVSPHVSTLVRASAPSAPFFDYCKG